MYTRAGIVMVNEKDRECCVCQHRWKALKTMFMKNKRSPHTFLQMHKNNGSYQLFGTYSVKYLLSVLHVLAHLVLIINTIKLLLLQLLDKGIEGYGIM